MHFCFEHAVTAERAKVFAFHEHPENLAVLLEGWPGFRLMHYGASTRPGQEVWFEQQFAYCAPIVMGFRHNLYEPPSRFGEEMIHGPFSRFDHVHEFESLPGGGTVVRDRLDVHLPWQYGGNVMMRLVVARTIARLFRVRHVSLTRLFCSTEEAESQLPDTEVMR